MKQAAISSTTPQTVLLTESKLTFEVDTASTDSGIFSVDDVNNEVIITRAGSYNFISTVTFDSTTNSAVAVTFNLRDTTSDAI